MNKSIWLGALALAFAAVLGGCNSKAGLTSAQQTGSNPPLPAPQNFLLPPMRVPNGVGWKQGQMPQVAAGLKIEKIASGLMHPRQLYVLP
jgi:glucose/arabinose dehydrogenase